MGKKKRFGGEGDGGGAMRERAQWREGWGEGYKGGRVWCDTRFPPNGFGAKKIAGTLQCLQGGRTRATLYVVGYTTLINRSVTFDSSALQALCWRYARVLCLL